MDEGIVLVWTGVALSAVALYLLLAGPHRLHRMAGVVLAFQAFALTLAGFPVSRGPEGVLLSLFVLLLGMPVLVVATAPLRPAGREEGETERAAEGAEQTQP
ncbi:MAG: hypothetical protein D6795_09200 [Deltaproteobacteria bacterium]|nr:MAG: hypothetical protein D6795_09200 [Deltaproteobacteria bacterium]